MHHIQSIPNPVTNSGSYGITNDCNTHWITECGADVGADIRTDSRSDHGTDGVDHCDGFQFELDQYHGARHRAVCPRRTDVDLRRSRRCDGHHNRCHYVLCRVVVH